MTVIRLARGVDRAGPGREVRRLLPRPQRRACWPAAAAAWRPSGLPDSAGVPKGAVSAHGCRRLTTKVPEIDESVACVIVEPVAANMGLGRPRSTGSSQGLRAACDARRRPARLRRGDHRLSPRARRARAGRCRRAARPVVLRQGDRRGPAPRGARGRPRAHVAAGAARAGLPGGHLVGEPAATAAGLAVLERLPDEAYMELEATCDASPRALAGDRRERAPGASPRVRHLCSVLLRRRAGARLRGARACGRVRSLRPVLPAPCCARGVALAPSPYEIAFVSLAHIAPTTSTARSRRPRRPPCEVADGLAGSALGHLTGEGGNGPVDGLGRPELVGAQVVAP